MACKYLIPLMIFAAFLLIITEFKYERIEIIDPTDNTSGSYVLHSGYCGVTLFSDTLFHYEGCYYNGQYKRTITK